ncbi:MAG: TraR/DksA C4-type zinc finger protein [Rhodopirellula sp.]|jgi:DnaK suppressor protein|nr:TraR/DksA C4-type zinc finger protein [Rhodopirellula sp.]
MSRSDALLRLHERLVARCDELRKKLSLDLDGEATDASRLGVGDLGDVASEGAVNELNSQLASIETRELFFIQRAILMIREGRYGICEGCDDPIPVARLKALPYSVMCVACQRSQEELGAAGVEEVDWDKACDYENRFSEIELTLDDLKFDR